MARRKMFPVFKSLMNLMNQRVYYCNWCVKAVICGDKYCSHCGHELTWPDLFNYEEDDKM